MYEVNPSAEHQNEAKAAAKAFADYVLGLMMERKKNPGNDLISDLAAVEESGAKLSAHELVRNTSLASLYRAAKNIAQHPIGILAKLRFRVTLNTDNRLMSQTSMTHEMTEVVGAFKWDFADLQRVTINGMKSAFIPYPERLEIIEKIIKPGYAAIASE